MNCSHFSFSGPSAGQHRHFSLYPRLFALLLALLPLAVRAQAPAPSAPSVGTILNPDGTVRAGMQGSFDASGYELNYGPNGEPLLRPTGPTALGWNAVGAPGAPNGVSGGGVVGPLSSYVAALAVSGSDLYVGGNFTQAGGIAANRVAKWNGTSWSSLGTGAANGVNRAVTALAISGSDLYVGGWFTEAGGIAANRVAKWDGTSWSSLGMGAANGVAGGIVGNDPFVSDLAISGSDLYVSGWFRQAGGIAANNVAKWNGTSWSSLGTGAANGVGGAIGNDPYVMALAISGSDLYVGGTFTEAGGIAAKRVAKWNGTSWSSLGTGPANGVNFTVFVLAVSGSDLYMGGWFLQAGGVAANRVAKWNGTNWSSLGTGVTIMSTMRDDASVRALALRGTDVYVGGRFTQAGGVGANYVAYYTPNVLSAAPATRTLTSLTLAPNPTQGSVRLAGAVAGAPVQVFDALGRLVLRATATAAGTAVLTLPAELARGLYIVRTGAQAKRLVLE